MTLKLKFMVLIALLLSISLVNAQTLIAGKVYDTNFENPLTDATVRVTCRDTTLTTKTLQDGTYALRFDNQLCAAGDTVSAEAEKGSFTATSSGQVSECGDDCDDDYFSIINLNAKDNTPSGGNSGGSSGGSGGSSGGGGGSSSTTQDVQWFICGNGFCDSGENEDTCPSDCKAEEEEEEEKETLKITQEPIETNKTAENKWINNGITGAFVAVGTYISIPILAAILAFLLILLIGYKIIERRKR